MYVYVILNHDTGTIEAVTKTPETAEAWVETFDPLMNYSIIRKKVWG